MNTKTVLLSIAAMVVCQASPAAPRVDGAFFNGRNLDGWSGSDQYWSVQDGQIVGYSADFVPDNEFLWAPPTVADFYLSFDVKLTPNKENGGVQFRSERRPDGHAFGYQADIGKGYWGGLYEEYGRAFLVKTDRGEKHVKPDEWNHYEVLAVRHRIWVAINGNISVAYWDPAGALEGKIAFQMHAGPPIEVRLKNLQLVHDPAVQFAGKGEPELNAMLMPRLPEYFKGFGGEFALRDGDTVVFVGSGNMAKTIDHGYLEAAITTASPGKRIRFRNMAWQGDTVQAQSRPLNFDDWQTRLSREDASVIVAWFDCMEAKSGEVLMKYYLAEYENFLNEVGRHTDRVVIVSPIPFEHNTPLAPNLAYHNPVLGKYIEGLQAMAERRGYLFVDLFTPFIDDTRPLSGRDGMHLTARGYRVVAEAAAKQFGLPVPAWSEVEPLRRAIVEKNKLWFDHWRPKNWAFLRGTRTFVEFSRDPAHEKRVFPDEIESFRALIEQAERHITELAQQ